jgi:putative nucleotidyltransferase with HDIG domain
VGNDITLFAEEGVDSGTAQSAVLHAALDAVRVGTPLSVGDARSDSHTLAVPLRVKGQLQSVCCLWRRGAEFGEDSLKGLELVSRIIELSIENRTLLEEVRSQLQGTLKALVTLVDTREPHYVGHSTNVAETAESVGRALGLNHQAAEDLRLAAMLHDLGMLQVPDHLIAAERPLTPDEESVVRLHAAKGANLARIANFSPAVQEAIHEHHERLDGTGYPRGLRGEQIGLGAKILAACDVFDAMISDRPYRAKLSRDQAVAELARGAGTRYDVRVVRELLMVAGYGKNARRPAASRAVPEPETVRSSAA